MPKKYDTNPLDGAILQRAETARAESRSTGETNGAPTAFFDSNVRNFRSPQTAEMPTQRYDNFDVAAPYESVLSNPVKASGSVSAAVRQNIQPLTSRRVSGLGIPENVAMILPYLPFTFGGIAAVIELLTVARTETRVRFHAAQALALHIAWLLVGVVLAFAGDFTSVAPFVSKLISIAVTFFFIVSIYRVWRGKAHHIEMLDDLTDFLNEKLRPQK
jgi:uncharacterized membrane protein